MLRERAFKIDRSMFSSPQRKSSLDQLKGKKKQNEGEGEDEIVEGEGSGSKKRKQIQHYRQLANSDSQKKNKFERDKTQKRERGEKKHNYSKLVKEINLPLEQDRKAILREASKLRLQKPKEAILNNLVKEDSKPVSKNVPVEKSKENKILPPIQKSEDY